MAFDDSIASREANKCTDLTLSHDRFRAGKSADRCQKLKVSTPTSA